MDRLDAVIHQERLQKDGTQKTFRASLATLPDGTFVSLDDAGNAYLWFQQRLFTWSFRGYTLVPGVDAMQMVHVLTPFSYVEVFKAGYVPQVHFSAK